MRRSASSTKSSKSLTRSRASPRGTANSRAASSRFGSTLKRGSRLGGSKTTPRRARRLRPAAKSGSPSSQTVPPDGSAGAAHAPHEGALARAGRAQDGEELLRYSAQRHIVEHHAGPNPQADAAQLEARRHLRLGHGGDHRFSRDSAHLARLLLRWVAGALRIEAADRVHHRLPVALELRHLAGRLGHHQARIRSRTAR